MAGLRPPFTIPHRDEIDAAHALQARPDKVDWQILLAAIYGYGWFTGGLVDEAGTPNLTVDVAAGTAKMTPDTVSWPGVSVAITPDTSSARFALIGVDSLPISTVARAGTTAHVVTTIDPLLSQWRVGDRVKVTCSNGAFTVANAAITAVGAGFIEYTVAGSGTIATVAATGSVVHVGALHGTPNAVDKPAFPLLPAAGFVALAAVLIPPNATAIVNADIIDKRAPVSSGASGDSYAAASVSGAALVDYNTARIQKLTLTGSITLTITGAVAGVACDLTLYLEQDGTGSRLVTWPASVKWPGGVIPTLSTGAGKVDLVVLESFDGGTTWYGNLAGTGYA